MATTKTITEEKRAILELHKRTQILERQVKALFARLNKLSTNGDEQLLQQDLFEVVKERG